MFELDPRALPDGPGQVPRRIGVAPAVDDQQAVRIAEGRRAGNRDADVGAMEAAHSGDERFKVLHSHPLNLVWRTRFACSESDAAIMNSA